MMKHVNVKTWVTGLILGVILIGLFGITLRYGLPLAALARHPQAFRSWLNDQGIFSAFYMIGIICLQIINAFIPGEPFEIVAGYAFGFGQGTLLCLLGSCLASGIIMVLVKTWGTKIIYVFFSKDKLSELWFLIDQKRLNCLTFIAYLIPGSPKDILTYAIGLTNMKLTTFMLLPTTARIPSVITSTFSGNALGEENDMIALFSFVFTLLISIIGWIIYAKYTKRKKECHLYKNSCSQYLTVNSCFLFIENQVFHQISPMLTICTIAAWRFYDTLFSYTVTC